MYKVLIVEDEAIIREGLKNNIPWKEMGFEVAGTACNGRKAVEMLENLHDEVVMTDVRMPVMDGIELAQYINEHRPEIKVIILSGYADFHYAQAALWKRLPETVTPAMARIALTRVIKKTLDAENTFREDGFLNIGVCGYQPKICQSYTTTASLYMATLAFLPLGLDENDEFWSSPDELSTWEKVFSGVDMPSDHAMVHDGRIY